MRVAILGAGFAGLAAAHELAKRGHQSVVYEATDKPGGLASGFRDERWEWPLERFYHHLFTTDWAIRDLVDEVGYGDKLVYRRQVTAQWWKGKAHPLQGGLEAVGLPVGPRIGVPDIVSTGLSVVSFPGLPLVHRLRMGLVSAYLKWGVRDWKPLERSTAAEWTRRWMGNTVYQAFVQPLLEGKFGPYANEVNMSWLWARLKARSFRLGYFDGGFQGFADALARFVQNEGVRIEFKRPVSALSPLPDGGWRMVSAPGLDAAITEAEDFDAVIATGSPGLLSKLVPQLPSSYLEQVKKLRSLGAVVMTIALNHQLLPGVYWLNMPKDEFPFLALVEHTNFVGTKPYGGDHLIYCGDYLDPSHEYFRLSQEELLERFLPALKAVNPRFEQSWIRASWLHREAYAQPIVPVNHSMNVPPIATPVPGLFWASMSQVYPWDRGTNYAVEIGQRAANEVLAYAHAIGK